AFRAGAGDYLETTQPAVEALVAAGAAHVVASGGQAAGPVPFTSSMAPPEFLAREGDVARRFTRAVFRTQRWLAGRGAAEIAQAVAAEFPEIDGRLRERAVARFRRQDTWARDPLLRRAGYD